MAAESLILQMYPPAIETATGQLIWPVPIECKEEFGRIYPTLKQLDKSHKGPNFYHCVQCKGELRARGGPQVQIHFFHFGSEGSCSSIKNDEDVRDDDGNWLNESHTHRTAKYLLCVMLDEKRVIEILGVKCSTNGCLNCLPDYILDYQEGDVVHPEYRLPNSLRRSDAALVNTEVPRHIFEIYYTHRSKDHLRHSWFEFKAADIISQFGNGSTITLQDIKPYDCGNHRFLDRPVHIELTQPICDRSEQNMESTLMKIAKSWAERREKVSNRTGMQQNAYGKIFKPKPRVSRPDLALTAKTTNTLMAISKSMTEFKAQEEEQRQDEERRRLEAEQVARTQHQLKQAQEEEQRQYEERRRLEAEQVARTQHQLKQAQERTEQERRAAAVEKERQERANQERLERKRLEEIENAKRVAERKIKKEEKRKRTEEERIRQMELDIKRQENIKKVLQDSSKRTFENLSTIPRPVVVKDLQVEESERVARASAIAAVRNFYGSIPNVQKWSDGDFYQASAGLKANGKITF